MRDLFFGGLNKLMDVAFDPVVAGVRVPVILIVVVALIAIFAIVKIVKISKNKKK